MKRNEGTLDRTVRIVIGLALITTAVTGILTPWGYIGVIPVLTGAMGWCPLYTLFGINTCGLKK